MNKKALFHNFSLRAGLTIFTVIFVSFLFLRLHIAHDILKQEKAEVRNIISAHVHQIDAQIQENTLRDVEKVIIEILNKISDEHLYIGLKRGPVVTGNIVVWPTVLRQPGWYEVTVDKTPLMVFVADYSPRIRLAVGYSLEPMQGTKKRLYTILWNNTLWAALLSVVTSVLLTSLLNLSLRRFNRSFRAIMQGQLGHRVKVYGSDDQIDQLALNVNNLLDWLQTLLQTVQDTTNHIAHDLRTPLSRLQIRIRTWQKDPRLDENWQKEFEDALVQTDYMQKLFTQILTLAKAEGQQARTDFSAIDVVNVLHDVLELHEAVFEEKGQKLMYTLPKKAMRITGHASLLTQAFSNLLDNAHKYSPPDTVVTLNAHADKTGLTITLEDQGGGIDAAILPHITQRFYRGDNTRQSDGFGLGLSLVDAVIRLHHGQLSLANTALGLLVTIKLPANTP